MSSSVANRAGRDRRRHHTGNLETLMPLYESEAAFATLPGSLAHGAPGVRQALAGFISMTASSTSR